MRRRVSITFTVIMLIAGLSLLLYPAVSNYIISLSHKQAITEYKTATESIQDNAYEKLLKEAHEYNAWIADRDVRLRDLNGDELEEYYKVLDPFGTGIMGYIVIPDINVSLPVYHGTDDAVLQTGAGHLPGTSLPVGGGNTHAILSAHTGLISAKLFTNISQMEKGDIFLIYVLNETLAYEVDNIKVILPEELGLEEIGKDEDWVTLLTCTPYGVNTHRLLVRGTRIEVPENAEEMQEIAEDVPAPDINLLKVFIVFILLIGASVIQKAFKKKKQAKEEPAKDSSLPINELKKTVRLSNRSAGTKQGD